LGAIEQNGSETFYFSAHLESDRVPESRLFPTIDEDVLGCCVNLNLALFWVVMEVLITAGARSSPAFDGLHQQDHQLTAVNHVNRY